MLHSQQKANYRKYFQNFFVKSYEILQYSQTPINWKDWDHLAKTNINLNLDLFACVIQFVRLRYTYSVPDISFNIKYIIIEYSPRSTKKYYSISCINLYNSYTIQCFHSEATEYIDISYFLSRKVTEHMKAESTFISKFNFIWNACTACTLHSLGISICCWIWMCRVEIISIWNFQ